MSELKTALVLGGSGLIGRQLVNELLESQHYQRVTVLLRRPLADLPEGAEQRIEDFDALIASAEPLEANDVFCCLGTTIKTVKGDKAAFYRIDHDYPVALAQLAQQGGAERCFVVSALGANAASRVYYNRVKGEMERDLRALNFAALHIYQPSLLIGKRDHLDQPSRSGEGVGQALMPLLNLLLQGALRKYRATPADSVAAAMAADAQRQTQGLEIHHFE
jgi:uncharacterized protein YbjT (DUF2867 family)